MGNNCSSRDVIRDSILKISYVIPSILLEFGNSVSRKHQTVMHCDTQARGVSSLCCDSIEIMNARPFDATMLRRIHLKTKQEFRKLGDTALV